ncbi:helix-turn-helix domain-containing protein [Paenibacillus alginolyticus]|uniref:AraC family transcriptional regulator n=1 Tax=Paenibacillus alginolyticus TaxID=59839 RepID=A0ABT4G6S6_9BACL|nr:helix-turn-helix domain-containing protein [Paenibacillus alginolyticus]MCY9691883.1 AraC family transcriptional regulator [Paenibacillus alginolyticus]MEC0144606.1 AraC family transcriptional regulator [Paenibacillus alginolyticus]
MSYMNIPYGLEEKDVPLCKFISIWEVQADDAYQICKKEGFDTPGLFITYEGKGTLSQLNDTYELHAGTFFFVQEGIPSTYRCQNNDWKFYFLDFSSLDMPLLLQLPVCEIVSTGKIAEAVQICERMINNLIAQPTGYAYSANILLQEVLLLFAREQSVASTSRHTELDKILIYIHKNMAKPIRVEELVQLSGLSRTSFFTRFRSITGLSPSDYMLKLKLESAKVSLETTNLSVKEIAANLHFYDEFHFSKLFKRTCGLSPSAFRRLHDDKKVVKSTG